jgi:hypothetical protein
MGNEKVIEHSILHEFPCPIAKCYEKVIGARDLFERWEKVRLLFEVTLKYCACLSIAGYIKTSHEDKQINAALKYLTRPSLGHWYNIFSLITKYLQSKNESIFPNELFEKIRDRPRLIAGWNAIRDFLDPAKKSTSESIYLMPFLENLVTYRNRTAGHGAPQSDHLEKMLPVFEQALVDLLLHLQFLKRIPLIFISEIKVERTSFVHILYRLMGTTKVLMKDLVTPRDGSLMGFDKQLFISRPDTEIPSLSLHPLIIYSQEDVFLLQNSNLKHNVEYLCHNSGALYSADRIYEDFKLTLGSFLLDDHEIADNSFEKEKIYLSALKMSLIDGVIEVEERDNLRQIARQLEISEARTKEIESQYSPENLKEILVHEPRDSYESGQLKSPAGITGYKGSRILFFPYASVRLGFWADLVSRLASSAHKLGMVFSMVAPDPQAEYDSALMTAMLADFDRILEIHDPQIIMIAPSPSRAFLSLFERHFGNIKVPMMSIDTELFNYDYFNKNRFPPPPIIQVDNVMGGELAASLLINRPQNNPEEKSQYLVMPGIDDAPHSMARIEGFSRIIKQSLPGSRVRILPSGGFLRKKAREVFGNFIEDADLEKFKGIFCCNDEMALGVYGLLCTDRERALSLPFGIVGFNNTLEMQSAIENDKANLLVGTIDQNLNTYIDTIWDVANKLIMGKKVETRYLIAPLAVKRMAS